MGFSSLLEWMSKEAIKRVRKQAEDRVAAGSQILDRSVNTAQEVTSPVAASLRNAAAALETRADPILDPILSAVSRVAPSIARLPLAVADAIAIVIAGIASVIELAVRFLENRVQPAIGRATTILGQRINPISTGLTVTFASAALLIGSQFLDYRGVAVGAPLYEGQIAADAPAPLTATAVTGDAHFWVMIPIAVVIAIAAFASLRRDNRHLGILICTLGLIVVAITLAIDLPKGLDPVYALPYSDASTRLLGGFWAELFAGVALAVSGGVLMRGDAQKRTGRRARQIQHRPDPMLARSN